MRRIAPLTALALLAACSDDDGGRIDAAATIDAPVVDAAPTVDAVDAAPRPDAVAQPPLANDTSVIYLHHSTGGVIWDGGVAGLVAAFNTAHGTAYTITELAFPSSSGYGWNNYPYDYWNIWVNHAGASPYMTEPTLEMLTATYDVIVFKHCFPVSDILAGPGGGVSDSTKTLDNYQAQYNALKTKLHAFPSTRFIVWTGAALVANATNTESAARARQFFTWVKNEWDEPGDNIYVWDFYELETEGGNTLVESYAVNSGDSHPTAAFATTVAPFFVNRLTSVIAGTGDLTSLTGQ